MVEENNNRKKVDFVIFTWAMGIMILIASVLFSMHSQINNKVDDYQKDISEVKIDVARTRTDVDWIKKNMESYQIGRKQSTLQSIE